MATSATFVVCGVLVVVFLAAGIHAQLGSVHCKVGCACSEEFRPVCGNDLTTYTNECKLRCRQCDVFGLAILYEGACGAVPPAPVVPAAIPAPAAVPVAFSPPVVYRSPFYPYPVNYVYAK